MSEVKTLPRVVAQRGKFRIVLRLTSDNTIELALEDLRTVADELEVQAQFWARYTGFTHDIIALLLADESDLLHVDGWEETLGVK